MIAGPLAFSSAWVRAGNPAVKEGNMMGNMRVAFAAVLAIFVFAVAIDGSGPAQAAEKDLRPPGPAELGEKILKKPPGAGEKILKKPPGAEEKILKMPPGAAEKDHRPDEPRFPGAQAPKSAEDAVRPQDQGERGRMLRGELEAVTFVIPVQINLHNIPDEFGGMDVQCRMLGSNNHMIQHISVEGFDRRLGNFYEGDGDTKVRIPGHRVNDVAKSRCFLKFWGPGGGREIRLSTIGQLGDVSWNRFMIINWLGAEVAREARFEAIRANHPGRAALEVRVRPAKLDINIRPGDWKIE